ncbi:unnamed protein product [Dovyalis caffra]|uniref:MADS-box domain-containing protein n=1 Tax=Dovyalis caffra TaxID=77055 RepID=A0AAV1R852_9ROSI|nr:unnamed protein product [Dovyalis caffra]
MEMKRIENQGDRLVTFSKRKSGIYKIASELITLTGAEIAVVVFSPAGKPFSFGYPSVESVINRFLGRDPPNNDNTHLMEAHRRVRIESLTQKQNEIVSQLDSDMEKGQKLKEKLIDDERKGWWDTPLEELNVQELIELENKFKTLHMMLCNKVMDINNGDPSSSQAP